MDDEKRTVLVAALSLYAELLSKNENQLDLEKGKGKGKQSDDDVDVTTEIQKQIQICGDLSQQITNATSGSDIARIFEVVCSDWEGLPENNDDITRSRSPSARSGISAPLKKYVADDEPYINPFTGLPVITETGFEAESSNSTLAPRRPAPILPRTPVPAQLGSSTGPPVRPASKPQHLRAQSVISSQSVQALAVISPPQRPAPPPPPSSFTEQREFKEDSKISVPTSDKMPVHTTDYTEKEVVMEQPTEMAPPYEVSGIHSTPGQPMVLSPLVPQFDYGNRHDRQMAPAYEEEVRSPTHKNRYMRYITDLASKAKKATGNMRGVARTTSVYQSFLPQSDSTRHTSGTDIELPAEVPSQALYHQRPMSMSRNTSQETFPPAYDSLSNISRRPSLASFSSAAGSHAWSLASPVSSRSSLSPSSLSPGVSPEPQYDSIQNSGRSSYVGSNSKPWRSQNRLSTPLSVASLRDGPSSSTSSNSAPRLNRSKTQSTTTLEVQSNNDVLAASNGLVAQVPIGRRQTTSPGSHLRTESGIFSDYQVNADAKLARHLSLDGSQSVARENSAAPVSKQRNIRYSLAHKPASARDQTLNYPSSNNPWASHMAFDEALARSLQQEEETELQMERDLLLAHKIANGTADDDDRDLAYFMHQKSSRSVDPTTVSSDTVEQASLLWGMDPEALKQQIDWLEAHEMGKTLKIQSSSDEASFLEAKRLQEHYDQEGKNMDAWEEWKGKNIETCTSCQEDHPREELVRECEHGYCNGCLGEGFKAALKSRAPFKCCKKALLIKDCIGLSSQFVTDYEEMILELSTPNPMFCSNTKCAKFLPPRAIVGDIGTCTKCAGKTCRHCRKKTHPNTFCAEDKETEAVKKLALAKGWKTCPGCNHLIERSHGCLHMVCSRCQTAFCYRCSKPWKDCESTCPDAVSATHPKR